MSSNWVHAEKIFSDCSDQFYCVLFECFVFVFCFGFFPFLPSAVYSLTLLALQIHTKRHPAHAGPQQADQIKARALPELQGQVWPSHHLWRESLWPSGGGWGFVTLLSHSQTHCFAASPTVTCLCLVFDAFPRSEFQRAGDTAACACNQCRHSG